MITLKLGDRCTESVSVVLVKSLGYAVECNHVYSCLGADTEQVDAGALDTDHVFLAALSIEAILQVVVKETV